MVERRTRKRRLTIDKEELVKRATDFADHDEQARQFEMAARAQRYAKYRQWQDDETSPLWEDASNAVLSDLTTNSLRTQDTLYNAVMTARPALISKATHEKDKDKQETIDNIIDYQAFVENGQEWLSELIEAFVNDGHFTAFIPWITEKRKSSTKRTAPGIPEDQTPGIYFRAVMEQIYPEAQVVARGTSAIDAWDYEITDIDGTIIDVSFFTDEEDNIEIVSTTAVTVFDGPKIIVKDRSDVLHSTKAHNLQIPGPSNPNGAAHVILVDHPDLDEILRLQRDGFYDLLTSEDVEDLKSRVNGEISQQSDEQKQVTLIDGGDPEEHDEILEHNTVVRYTVFDTIDIDGDGVTEDVVYWILRESRKVLRLRRLAEVYPGTTPRRPFAEETFIPVKGSRIGMSILEMVEPAHDLRKAIIDQTIDHGSLALSPFFFYRPSSSMKPEVIKLFPGDGYPLSDPRNDVNFPALPQGGQAYAFNMLNIVDRDQEKVSMVGDLQLGRVPEGKASALRTVRGMALISGQGEARPARLLHRFFTGLGQIWAQIHELDRHLLPPNKQIRVATSDNDAENPYITINRKDLDGVFEFEFTANVFNTSKQVKQEALSNLASLYISEIGFMTGISNEKTVYNLFKDMAKAFGQDPDRYITPPQNQPLISFEEALNEIMNNTLPQGIPQEGPQQHLQKLQDFVQSEQFGFLEEGQLELFSKWADIVAGFAQELAQQQALAQASAQQGGGGGGGGPEGRPPEGGPVDNTQATLQNNELADEGLPTAGGGGQGQ
jgi:hypothetical protein